MKLSALSFQFVPHTFGLRFFQILDATAHLYKRSCPSVNPSVPPSLCPVLFANDDKRLFLNKKSSNDIINNDTMSNDEVVISDVPP